MNKGQIKGRANTTQDKSKEIIGEVVGNNELNYKVQPQIVRPGGHGGRQRAPFGSHYQTQHGARWDSAHRGIQ